MAEELNYGKYYWYIKVTKDVSENGELYVMADQAEIKDGILLFIQNKEEGSTINMALAPGTWSIAYVTSIK